MTVSSVDPVLNGLLRDQLVANGCTVAMARYNGGRREYRVFKDADTAIRFVLDQPPMASITFSAPNKLMEGMVDESFATQAFAFVTQAIHSGREVIIIANEPDLSSKSAAHPYSLVDNLLEFRDSLSSFSGGHVTLVDEPDWWCKESFEGSTPKAFEALVPLPDGTLSRGRY